MSRTTAKAAKKYTPEQIEYVQKHYNVDMRDWQVAAHIGVKVGALRQQVTRWRERGIEIRSKGALPGERRIVNPTTRGACIREKQADGSWKYVGVAVRQPKKKEPKKVAPVSKPKSKTAPSKADGEKVATIANKVAMRAFTDRRKRSTKQAVTNCSNPEAFTVRQDDPNKRFQWDGVRRLYALKPIAA